jgi:hypothetical protein
MITDYTNYSSYTNNNIGYIKKNSSSSSSKVNPFQNANQKLSDFKSEIFKPQEKKDISFKDILYMTDGNPVQKPADFPQIPANFSSEDEKMRWFISIAKDENQPEEIRKYAAYEVKQIYHKKIQETNKMQIDAMKTETNLNNIQNTADDFTFNGFSDMVKGGEYFYKKSDNNPKEALEALGNIGMGFGKCVAVAIPAEQLLKVTGKAGIYLFKIIGKTKTGKSIVKYIGKEANAIGNKLGMKATQKKVIDGASRAAKYGKNWPKASLKDAINKFAPGAKPIKTQSGKLIYKNTKTGTEVVYDTKGNYFRIKNNNLPGKNRQYIDMNGQNVTNKTINGKQMGRPPGEYKQITHYTNID